MKRTGLILTCILLFAISLYVAYVQGVAHMAIDHPANFHLSAPLEKGMIHMPFFWAGYMHYFSIVLNGLSGVFAGSLIAAIVVMALLVEMITLYPAVNLQLKQKKIHLFHKKLVDRFRRGELTMGASKRELDVLYSVNERIHRRGAWLIIFQLIVLISVFVGLSLVAEVPAILNGTLSTFNHGLLLPPLGVSLPILVSLAFLLHSLVKIYLKQREDYIDSRQVYTAVGIALLSAGVVFYFSSIVAVVLSVFFLTQITFANIRYIIVENRSKEWGKFAQRELIKLLRTADLHKNKLDHLSRKFHHLPVVRHLNFHLLEEAASMSLAIVLVISGMIF